MRNPVWWKSGVIYHIYPRSFNDSSGDGIGDLQGIIDKLDYLNSGTNKSLGIAAIWLSPIYPSPQVDFGYDVTDYTGIDPVFGDISIFRHLVDECHRRNIRVILDLVLNHTSDYHPWFIESRSSLDNPRRDWYIWRNGANNKPPNNWGSYFGGPAWHLDEATGQYYLAMFDPSQPDLNWRNPQVKSEIFYVLRHWLDFGVDGFRLDVYNQYFKDAMFRSNPRRLNPLGLFYRFMGQKHIHDRDQPEMYQVLKEMRQLVDSYPDRMLIGETADEGDFMSALGYYGRENEGLHLAFNFDFLNSKWQAPDFRKAVRKWQEHLPDWGWPTYVLSNHDVIRHAARYKHNKYQSERMKIAAAMLLTLRGTPTVYYGEEIGLSDIKLKKTEIMDPPGKRFWPLYKGRDGCRVPMAWDKSMNGGFTAAVPWLPVAADFEIKNVSSEDQAPDSLLNFYRRLIWLRNETPALHSGDLVLIDSDHENILGYSRTNSDDRIVVFLNFSHREQQLEYRLTGPTELLVGSHRSHSPEIGSKKISLTGNEILIIRESE